jgi:hypothetical protein
VFVGFFLFVIIVASSWDEHTAYKTVDTTEVALEGFLLLQPLQGFSVSWSNTNTASFSCGHYTQHSGSPGTYLSGIRCHKILYNGLRVPTNDNPYFEDAVSDWLHRYYIEKLQHKLQRHAVDGMAGFDSRQRKDFFSSLECQDWFWSPLSLQWNGFHNGCRSVKLTTHLHLLPRSRLMELYFHSPIRLHTAVRKHRS